MQTNLPTTYNEVLNEMRMRLKELPGYVQILAGPRQVGKTTLLLELAKEWKDCAVYSPADSVQAVVPEWWEEQWERARRLAAQGPALLLLDEIQYIADWSRHLKAKWDENRRMRIPVHVIVSGSSALNLGQGCRETMAGRFERLRILHWTAKELVVGFGLSEKDAVRHVARFGGLPGAMRFENWPRRQEYVRTAVVEPAIGRDVLAMESVRRPSLLRQVFAVAVSHPAEIVSLSKIAGLLSEKGSLHTVAHYLHLLEDACLIAAVEKYSESALRRRSAPPKLVALNQAYLSAIDSREPPLESEPERWGRWIENCCIAHAWNSGQQIRYWRREPLEVDMILDGSWGKWAVEVKTGAFHARDLAGLYKFCAENRGYQPLVLCDAERLAGASDASIPLMAWQAFLWKGLERGVGT